MKSETEIYTLRTLPDWQELLNVIFTLNFIFPSLYSILNHSILSIDMHDSTSTHG